MRDLIYSLQGWIEQRVAGGEYPVQELPHVEERLLRVPKPKLA